MPSRGQGGRTLWAAGQRSGALSVGAVWLPLTPGDSLRSGLAQGAALPEPVGCSVATRLPVSNYRCPVSVAVIERGGGGTLFSGVQEVNSTSWEAAKVVFLCVDYTPARTQSR